VFVNQLRIKLSKLILEMTSNKDYIDYPLADIAAKFQELAKFREKLGLPVAGSENDGSTVAKLEIGDREFFGVNSGSDPNPRRVVTLRVNPISKTHAEADVMQQAFDAGIRGGRARLIVDRDLCRPCGQNGGVKGMAKQLDLEELEVISPSSCDVIKLK